MSCFVQFLLVELQGFEPWSGHDVDKLSTSLVKRKLSGNSCSFYKTIISLFLSVTTQSK